MTDWTADELDPRRIQVCRRGTHVGVHRQRDERLLRPGAIGVRQWRVSQWWASSTLSSAPVSATNVTRSFACFDALVFSVRRW